MVILYGSYAKGEERDFSDVDLIIVSKDFNGGTVEDHLLLSRTARKITPQIEALPYRPEDIKNRAKGGFLDEVLNHGKIIYKAA